MMFPPLETVKYNWTYTKDDIWPWKMRLGTVLNVTHFTSKDTPRPNLRKQLAYMRRAQPILQINSMSSLTQD